MIWNDDAIDRAIRCLKKHERVVDAADEMGVSTSALRNAFRAAGELSPSCYLKEAVPSENPETEEEKEADDSEGVPSDKDEPKGIKHSFSKRYMQVGEEPNDNYVLWLKCRKGLTDVIAGEDIRAAKRMYSNWDESGPEASINHVCRTMGWPRAFFMEMKEEMGWTHDQDPFTKEEHEQKTPVEIMNDLEMMSRERLERARQQLRLKEMEDGYKKWKNFNEEVLQSLHDAVDRQVPSCIKTMKLFSPFETVEYNPETLYVFAPFDSHIEKLGHKGEGHALLRERLIGTTQELVAKLAKMGRPGLVDIALGSDWWNSDTYEGTTTAGTPQDNDGTTREGVVRGLDLSLEYIQTCRQLGPCRVRVVPGNHDRHITVAAWWALKQIFKDCPDVEVVGEFDEYQYSLWGNSLIGWHHGDTKRGAKGVNYALRMMKHHRDLYAQSIFQYQIVGHLHFLEAQDNGIIVLQVPSLSHDDSWHYRNMYDLSQKGQVAFVISKEGGLEGIIPSWVK